LSNEMPTSKQKRSLDAAHHTLSHCPTPDDQKRHALTDDQRRILDDARATLTRHSKPSPDPSPPVEPVRYKTHVSPAAEPPQPETPAAVDWAAYIEQRIEQERAFTIAVVGESLGKALADAKADYKKAHQKGTAELNLEITKLKCVCDELRIALGAERRGTVLDLPALPRRSDLN
jgi:hypothetical protein